MKPHQQRVIEEKEALDEKIQKLIGFLNSGKPFDVPIDEVERLDEQLSHMNQYSRVLGERISHFV